MVSFLMNLNVKVWMWVILIIFFCHEMEKWNILRWYYSTYNSLPKSTNLSTRIVAGVFLTAVMLIQGLISPILVLIFGEIAIPFIIETIRAKNTFFRAIEFLHNYSLKIVEALEK